MANSSSFQKEVRLMELEERVSKLEHVGQTARPDSKSDQLMLRLEDRIKTLENAKAPRWVNRLERLIISVGTTSTVALVVIVIVLTELNQVVLAVRHLLENLFGK
jgi:hypothetical protein